MNFDRKCDHCETTESENWHEDSQGVVICDDCYDAYCERLIDKTSIGYEV